MPVTSKSLPCPKLFKNQLSSSFTFSFLSFNFFSVSLPFSFSSTNPNAHFRFRFVFLHFFSITLLLHSMTTDSTVAVPVSSNDSVSSERKFLKHIRDNVHGNIFLEPVTVFFSILGSSFKLSFEYYFSSFILPSLFSITVSCICINFTIKIEIVA